MTLLETTIQLMKNRPASLTLQELAKDVGATPDYLSKVMNGVIPNPSVNTIEKIYVRLSGKQLFQ